MKYWDTSAILRAWKEGWIPVGGMTRSHTVAEWVSVQTGRGMVYQQPDGTLIKRNLSPADAASEARKLFQKFVFCDLSAQQMLEAIDMVGRRSDIAGVAVHDFMHARVAELNNAECVVTINLADFSRMTKLPIELPTQTTLIHPDL